MNVQDVIKLLLDRMNTRAQLAGGVFAAFGGTAGNMQMLQRDTNAAIKQWQEEQDKTGLRQLTATLQAYGSITDSEYEQVMEILNGES